MSLLRVTQSCRNLIVVCSFEVPWQGLSTDWGAATAGSSPVACAAANLLLFPFWMFLVAFWQRPALQCPWTAFCQGPQGRQPHYSGAEVPSPPPALGMSLLYTAGDTQAAKPPGVQLVPRETPRVHSVTMKLSYSFIQLPVQSPPQAEPHSPIPYLKWSRT